MTVVVARPVITVGGTQTLLPDGPLPRTPVEGTVGSGTTKTVVVSITVFTTLVNRVGQTLACSL